MTRDGEELEDSEQRMSELLVAQGRPGSMVWTFAEDYLWNGRVLFVGPVDGVANRRLIRRIFDDVVRYPFGVQISMMAATGKKAYCAIFAPQSQLDAEYEMIHGIKYAIPTRRVRCKAVVDDVEWARMLSAGQVKGYGGHPDGICMRRTDCG